LQQCLATEAGDYIIRRADGIHAYHLAVVIDDYLQGITEVVRGADLLDATPRQIYLQQLLQFPTPAYCHLPVATDRQGLKISKQNQAPRINHDNDAEVLYQT
jgi:glutamyl-Q tRNA(Asp) synthetase